MISVIFRLDRIARSYLHRQALIIKIDAGKYYGLEGLQLFFHRAIAQKAQNSLNCAGGAWAAGRIEWYGGT